jgi:N-acetylglucosaminyldiphosphoundecaprenol N-acetyl-beta-D-mannosaminyltransferase
MIKRRDGYSNRVVLDGLAFDNVTMGEAIQAVEDHIDRGKGMLVVTTNVDNLLRLGRDEEFRRTYASADLVLADGIPLLWLARLQGTPMKNRVSGADFVAEYCRTAVQEGRRVFFLGGMDGVAQSAADVLQRRFPGLIVAGAHSPSWGFDQKDEETRQIVEMIKSRRPDVVFVAAGAPKQEKWLSRHRAEFGPVVCMGVGAAFDFVSGRKRRAPPLIRNHGLEWFWRLVHEPRRLFRRYILEDFPFFFRLLIRVCARRLTGGEAPISPPRDASRQESDTKRGLP